MKHLLLSALLLILPVKAQNATTQSKATVNENAAITQIHSSYSHVEKAVRNAAVKVSTPDGHGSGGLIKYKDMTLVLTAQHVADGALGQTYLIGAESEDHLAILIYSDPLNDIALLYLAEDFRYAKPMRWKTKNLLTPIATEITYSGYPSWHSLLSFRGSVAGYELIPHRGQQIILQTYGYFGSSGSVIYDSDYHIVGVLWGVDVQRDGVHENIVWVSPIQKLDINLAIKPLCTGLGNKPRACR